ncbi:MAG: pyruvate kinase [Planctomycetota bacterium]|jgi:pyruvate kinase
MIKTKIIATLGPACSRSETIKAMIDNGVDLFRLNFSHGSTEQHQQFLSAFLEARAGHHHTIALIGDLCGPKIRAGKIKDEGRILDPDEEVIIEPGIETGTETHFSTNYENFADDVKVGDRVFVDDGQIELIITKKTENKIICKVIIGGPLFSRKGINLPDSTISTPSITEYDFKCAKWAVKNKLDFLALSFVRSADDIKSLKNYLLNEKSDIKVISKIEKPQALDELENIIKASDAVLIARGDLGVEMDLAQVPVIQKRITNLCRLFGKPVIVATQMLQSMIENPNPTRAEVSDVANAIMDFTDAVMLSGETAVGRYPLQAAKTIQRIAAVTENYIEQTHITHLKTTTPDDLIQTAAMARSVAQIIEDTDIKLVAAWSETGSTARLLSKNRIDVPILAFSSSERACFHMCLHYGVIPRCQPRPENIEEFTKLAQKIILERKWANPSDKIIIVSGEHLGAAGTTNTILIHTLTN